MLYYKWHNATSHSTNECKVFRQQLQLAIESGRIKFGNSKIQKLMKIDQHPFPANMLDAEGKIKVLTSEAAEKNASFSRLIITFSSELGLNTSVSEK
jgi:hypothetical protein